MVYHAIIVTITIVITIVIIIAIIINTFTIIIIIIRQLDFFGLGEVARDQMGTTNQARGFNRGRKLGWILGIGQHKQRCVCLSNSNMQCSLKYFW